MHLTINTGHVRRSYRDEADDALVTMMAQDLAEAQTGVKLTILPGYKLMISPGSALLATVETDAGDALATLAVVGKSRDSAKMWGILQEFFEAIGDAPSVPWCAAKLHPDAYLDTGAMTWLGDYERCLAWAWLERRK